MAVSQSFPIILGEKIKHAREKLGLSIDDLATQATLSKKQLDQIENGGDGSFYSAAIKLIAARKVARILDLAEDEYLEKFESSNSSKKT
jgi:transcriptional regulator with XRE-family HTH domain